MVDCASALVTFGCANRIEPENLPFPPKQMRNPTTPITVRMSVKDWVGGKNAKLQATRYALSTLNAPAEMVTMTC
jgi:hypothetical protein